MEIFWYKNRLIVVVLMRPLSEAPEQQICPVWGVCIVFYVYRERKTKIPPSPGELWSLFRAPSVDREHSD